MTSATQSPNTTLCTPSWLQPCCTVLLESKVRIQPNSKPLGRLLVEGDTFTIDNNDVFWKGPSSSRKQRSFCLRCIKNNCISLCDLRAAVRPSLDPAALIIFMISRKDSYRRAYNYSMYVFSGAKPLTSASGHFSLHTYKSAAGKDAVSLPASVRPHSNSPGLVSTWPESFPSFLNI